MIRFGDSEIPLLRKAAKDASCIRCNVKDETVVGAHYTGARRLAYGGGLGKKVHDLVIAHLCGRCHSWMDNLSRNKEDKWLHSEEFLHLVVMTILRLYQAEILVVKGAR